MGCENEEENHRLTVQLALLERKKIKTKHLSENNFAQLGNKIKIFSQRELLW